MYESIYACVCVCLITLYMLCIKNHKKKFTDNQQRWPPHGKNINMCIKTNLWRSLLLAFSRHKNCFESIVTNKLKHDKKKVVYMSNWLKESGNSWLLSCHWDCEGRSGGGGSGAYCWGKKCGCADEAKKGCWGGGGDGGGLVVAIMFHQPLGPPASICCTGELCNTFPLFISPIKRNKNKLTKDQLSLLALILSLSQFVFFLISPKPNTFVFVETLRGLPRLD